METQYLRFVTGPSAGTTTITEVFSKSEGSVLATIKWYGPWRQYCFYPKSNTVVFNTSCLRDICTFIDKLMSDRRVKII